MKPAKTKRPKTLVESLARGQGNVTTRRETLRDTLEVDAMTSDHLEENRFGVDTHDHASTASRMPELSR